MVERALHESSLEEFGVGAGLAQSPACAFCASHLLATASERSYEEAAAHTCERGRARTLDAFVTPSRLEWMFWDNAHRKEAWPP